MDKARKGELKRVINKANRLAHKWSKLTKKVFKVIKEQGSFCFVFIECPCAPPNEALDWGDIKKHKRIFPYDLGIPTKFYLRVCSQR